MSGADFAAVHSIVAKVLVGDVAARLGAVRELLSWQLSPPSETPLDGPVGPHRIFDWLALPLDDLKLVKNALACTVNDVVLTTVTGAIREFLIRRQVRPDDLDFRVAAPVDVRGPGQIYVEYKTPLGYIKQTVVLSRPLTITDDINPLTYFKLGERFMMPARGR